VTPPASTGGIRAVAPQVPSYLVAPNALFQAGLNNVRTLHQQLGEARAADAAAEVHSAGSGAFLHAYGGDWDYRSNLGIANYGVDADIRHTAMLGGVDLAVADGWHVALAASMGEIELKPDGVNGARKTKLDQWMVSPHVSWQGAGGLHVEATLSHGAFTGNVSTLQRGRTARLKGDSQAVSLGGGYPIALGNVTLEPQVQAVWQRLAFENATDVDGFPVQLGTHTQRTARAGAEMSFAGPMFKIYGRAHVSRTFGDGQSVWLGSDFQVGRMGNALESGLGFDASLPAGKVSIYGDVGHQKRLGGTGHQGWGGNLGVKMRF